MLADRKKTVTAADLMALVSDQLEDGDDAFQLIQWRAISAAGSRRRAASSSVATEPRSSATAEGNGPVDALLQAIDVATGDSLRAGVVPRRSGDAGRRCSGTGRLRIRSGEQVFTGHGLATDIVEASARAYLAALSRSCRATRLPMIAGPVSAVSSMDVESGHSLGSSFTQNYLRRGIRTVSETSSPRDAERKALGAPCRARGAR